MRIALAVAVGWAALVTHAAPASAQDDAAAAEALFQEARRLMKAGDNAAACPKLEESQRLDPGTGTLWHLARCYEATGKLASAWAKFHEVAQLARRQDEGAKVKAALARAGKLEGKLYRVVIAVPKQHRIKGLTIVRNGTEVGAGAYGIKVPVDEGTMLVRASAPGHEPWTTEVDIGGDKRVRMIEIPRLEREDSFITEPGPTGPVEYQPWHRDRIGLVLAGAGVVAIAVGGGVLNYAYGERTKSKQDGLDLDERQAHIDNFNTYQPVGFGLLLGGAALATAGVVKLLMRDVVPADDTETAAAPSVDVVVTSERVTLGLSGRF